MVFGAAVAAWPGRLGAGLALQAMATGLLGASGAAVLFGANAQGAAFRSTVDPALGLDALSGFFLVVLALTGVLAARDVTTFLAFWELMTLVPAAAIVAARRDDSVRAAVFYYMAVT